MDLRDCSISFSKNRGHPICNVPVFLSYALSKVPPSFSVVIVIVKILVAQIHVEKRQTKTVVEKHAQMMKRKTHGLMSQLQKKKEPGKTMDTLIKMEMAITMRVKNKK
jgi:hypothetical protein